MRGAGGVVAASVACYYYIMAREAVMKGLVQDGSDVPEKIIMKNTLGYGSPRSQEQMPEMKDAEEEV